MTLERMIAVCDIFGFKQLIRERPLREVLDGHLEVFRQALTHAATQGETTEYTALEELQTKARVGLKWFSDTVVLCPRNDAEEDRRDLMVTVGWLVFNSLFLPRRPVRARVAYGEFEVDERKGILVGPARSPLKTSHPCSGGSELSHGL